MSERINTPDPDCAQMCSNANTDVCIEVCSVKGDCELFKLKKDIYLPQLKNYSLIEMEDKTWKARVRITEGYTAKLIDFQLGVIYESKHPRFRRSRHDRTTSSQVPPNIQVENLLPDLTQANTSSSVGEERQSETIRPDNLDKPKD